MTYSVHFRKKILKEAEGNGVVVTSKKYSLSTRSINQWKKRLEPKTTRNRTDHKISKEALLEDVEDFPNNYQYERAERLGVSKTCIQTSLKRYRISNKKTLNHPNADKEKQKQFEDDLKTHKNNNRNVVYIDETGFEQLDFRPRGYSVIGECVAQGSWQKSKRTNAIGALCNGYLFSIGLFDCSIDSECFYAWVIKILLPQLPEKSVLVMDNASFHKRSDIIEVINKNNHSILWLPPYSPEYNPIEKTWAWLKKLRHKWQPKSIDDLFNRFIERHSIFV